jgi:hypothetical protein
MKGFNMSLVADGYDITVSLMDNGGNVTQKAYVSRATTDAEATTAAGALLTALGGVTDCAIRDYSINKRFIEDTLVYPASGVQIENQAEITVALTSSPNKSATLNIPAPKIGIFAGTAGAAANNVDLLDTALNVYFDLFEDSAATGFAISDGETMANAIIGKRIHRKSRKG